MTISLKYRHIRIQVGNVAYGIGFKGPFQSPYIMIWKEYLTAYNQVGFAEVIFSSH